MAIRSRIKVGTRGSPLAIKQAEEVCHRIKQAYPEIEIEPIEIKTTGDNLLDQPLASAGGKGLFIKELETALLEDRIDCAVHSLKDIPVKLPRGFQIAAITERLDPSDVFLSRKYSRLDAIPSGAVIGTSSTRRIAQIKAFKSDVRCELLRGNIGTRINKLDKGLFDGIIVAAAGLIRLGLLENSTEVLRPERFVPAAGQGALGLEIKKSDVEMGAMIKTACHHHPTATAVSAERSFLETIGGDCHSAVGAFARMREEQLALTGWIATKDGSQMMCETFAGSPKNPEEIGRKLAALFIRRGAKKIIFG